MTILKQMNACALSSQPVVDILSALFFDLFLFFFSLTGKYIYKLMSVINIFAGFFPIFLFYCLSLSLSLAFAIRMLSCTIFVPRQLLHFQRMIFSHVFMRFPYSQTVDYKMLDKSQLYINKMNHLLKAKETKWNEMNTEHELARVN